MVEPTKQFGSDVYVNYTAVYTWQSNQMAHATMGFAGTTVLAYGLAEMGCSPWWALLFAIIPALKDITDFAIDRTRAGHIFRTTAGHVYELREDGLTDNWFWNIGTLFAVFLAVGASSGAWATWILFLVTLAWAGYGILGLGDTFTAQKRRYDVSALPYFFRLPNFAGNPIASIAVDDADETREEGREGAVKAVEDFTYGQIDAPRHLVLFGPPRCRKTTLASAIGSGLTVRGRKVRYLPQSTLADELNSPPPADRADDEPLPPQEAGIVIVDDVGAACPPDLAKELAGKRTVWVIAKGEDAAGLRRELRDALGGSLTAIELGQPNEEDRLDRQPVPQWLNWLSWGTLGTATVAILGSLILVLF